MNKFLEKQNLPYLTQEDAENLNSPLFFKKNYNEKFFHKENSTVSWIFGLV